MRAFARLRSFASAIFGRSRIESDMDEELRAHIEDRANDLKRSGLSRAEAERRARLEFGGYQKFKEECREAMGAHFVETFVQDVRYGLRTLRKSPGFTAVAVLTLALGIGANTAIFSLIDAMLLRALPVASPSQLVVLKWHARNMPNMHGYFSSGDCPSDMALPRATDRYGCSFSESMFREIEKAGVFSGIAAFANANQMDLTGNGAATVIDGQLVSGGFFRTLGIKTASGRLIETGDDKPSAAPVAVLSYGYWQSAFGGSPSVVGRTIQLNNVPFTIVGVAEQRFTGITPGSDYDVWLPLSDAQRITDPLRWQNRQGDVGFWWLTLVGRLKPGTQLNQAQAAVTGLFRNAVLHGPVPLFHAGGMPGMPIPGPHGPGGGMIQRQMVFGGGPDARPLGGGSPRRIQVPSPGAAKARPPMEAGNEAPGRAKPHGPAIASNDQQTLSPPADNPEVALLPAQTGLVGARGQYIDPLYVLMLAVGIILLIACANVAGLMLARGAARQKELAVRLALGAGRRRIIRQLLTESVMLSALGGAFGILLAIWGAATIVSFVSSNQPRSLGIAMGVDMRVMGFVLAITVVTGILFGLAPTFRGVRVDLTPTLKEGEGSSPSSRRARVKWFGLGNALVIAQVALAVVVLVGAGLLVRTLENLRSVDIGFDSHNILNFSINPTLIGYNLSQVDALYRDLQDRFAATPGVKSASYSIFPLLSNRLEVMGFHWPGTPQDQASEAHGLGVGPDFFKTMRIPFLDGRDFTASDFALTAANGASRPTNAPTPVIVNQVFVKKYVGNENPLGQLFGKEMPPGYEIVGVVRDTKYADLRQEIPPMVYSPQRGLGATFELRTAADPRAILAAIRKVVAEVNPNLPLYDISTESQQIDRLLFQERLVARLAGFFGLLALVLACIGLYGLLSYEVSRRTRELGVRMALGAQPQGVLTLVLKRGIVLAVIGAVVGIGVALGVTRYLGSMLYGVQANDPLTLICVAALLIAVALAACYVPARRATRVDPMVALRHE